MSLSPVLPALSANGRFHSIFRLGDVVRVALAVTPQAKGDLLEQVAEVVAALRSVLRWNEWPLFLTTQTVFLRDAADQPACEKLFAASGLHRSSITQFVLQPPCSGARIAVEAWIVGGPGVSVEKLGAHAVAVDYEGIHWLHLANVGTPATQGVVYDEVKDAFQGAAGSFAAEGMTWENVVRTWWYLGGITGAEGNTQRYLELNRARADAFAGLHFGNGHMQVAPGHTGFPASTGIGMEGTGFSLAALAMKTPRHDVRLLPLENPVQIPAYDYAGRYSPQSPKFSRAMALVTPDYVTTWISGTASIVQSEVCHPDDVVAQTEQTLDNIAALIAAENFARHGVSRAGASLRDLAKVRVYIKRAADYAACRAVCERRLGNVPAIYVVVDICRPELLIEIEGVAFSRRPTPPAAC